MDGKFDRKIRSINPPDEYSAKNWRVNRINQSEYGEPGLNPVPLGEDENDDFWISITLKNHI